MPVRRVSSRGGNIIGKFPSFKMRRMIAFESLIERDYLYVLDYEPEVEWFEEQPLTIEYQYDGKTLHYTPDFHIIETGRDVLVECKPDVLTDRSENRRKFRAALAWCAEREWDFLVVTDSELRTGYRLENIKFMTYYARLSIPPQFKGQVYTMLETAPAGVTVGDVVQALVPSHPAVALPAIMHMAFHHEVTVSLESAPLSLCSLISLPVCHPHQLLEVKP
jgi:hypothetical protein